LRATARAWPGSRSTRGAAAAHLESLPAIQRYVAEVTSDAAWSDDGYLTAVGMVPMMVDERQKYGYIAEHWVEPACPPFCR
jgi:hypothetical protein